MTIREAIREDLPGILEIYNEAVVNSTATYDYEPLTLAHRVAWYEEHVRDGYPVFVAVEESGAVLGWSALNRYHNRPGYRFTTESSIYVAADQRGRGVGRQLMPPIIGAAREKGLHSILAGIDTANEVSIRFHEKFGFEKVAHLKQVGFKFERWLDVVYLQLML